MKSRTVVEWKRKHTNLHVYIEGLFDSETALRVAMIVKRQEPDEGNIFVHTRKLTDVAAHSKDFFGSLASLLQLPRETFYFTGVKGFQICHDGGRVIISKREREQMESAARQEN